MNRLYFRPIIASIICFLSSGELSAQQRTVDLAHYGVPPAVISKCDEPLPLFGISYVGNDMLFVTYAPACTFLGQETVKYTALLVDHNGDQHGKLTLTGGISDVVQRRFVIQPLDHVLIMAGRDLGVYDLGLTKTNQIHLPDRSFSLLTPDRISLAIVAQSGNEAELTLSTLGGVLTSSRHLNFDERVVREHDLTVSNRGAVAHAVPDRGAELGVDDENGRWPAAPVVGQFDQPLTFTSDDTVLVSIVRKRPFPPTNLYLWNLNGSLRKIEGAKSDYFKSASISANGQRVLLTQTHSNFFVEMLGGFDCGGCGDSSSYVLIDIASLKQIKQLEPGWKCVDALSPSGQEIAELCGNKLRFLTVP